MSVQIAVLYIKFVAFWRILTCDGKNSWKTVFCIFGKTLPVRCHVNFGKIAAPGVMLIVRYDSPNVLDAAVQDCLYNRFFQKRHPLLQYRLDELPGGMDCVCLPANVIFFILYHTVQTANKVKSHFLRLTAF